MNRGPHVLFKLVPLLTCCFINHSFILMTRLQKKKVAPTSTSDANNTDNQASPERNNSEATSSNQDIESIDRFSQTSNLFSESTSPSFSTYSFDLCSDDLYSDSMSDESTSSSNIAYSLTSFSSGSQSTFYSKQSLEPSRSSTPSQPILIHDIEEEEYDTSTDSENRNHDNYSEDNRIIFNL